MLDSKLWSRETTFKRFLLNDLTINYEVYYRRDVMLTSRADTAVILTTRDFLEQLNFVMPKTSYTLQEATEHLLQFGALLRARMLDTFGSLLYVYYDDFGITEVEALRKVYREIFERRYDVFDLVPSVLKDPDTRPSRICAEIYDRATDSYLKNSANMCRRIRKQHDLPHPDDYGTPAVNVTYRMYRSSKISKKYPGGFSLATMLRFLQREVLTITPNLLVGLIWNVKYENYDDDVRLAEKELVQHFYGITDMSQISVTTRELKNFYTVNSFLKYYIEMYAEKLLDNDLKKHAALIVRRIADDIGTIDENIHLLGNVYENQTIHVKYLFDLVLSDDLLETDVIEAKKYLVMKLEKYNVVERYLKVQMYQQITPVQLIMEITGQLKDINFAKNIATSLRIHAKFWQRNHMIESLDDLLELFDTYENLRKVPRYVSMMLKIDEIKESLQDMRSVPVEILCNAPRACLRIGLQMVLRCKLINSEIKNLIKSFLELSDVCAEPVHTIEELRRSVDIPFKISKVRYSTILHSPSTLITETSTQRIETTKSTIEMSTESEELPSTTEFTSTTSTTTVPSTTTEQKPISTTQRETTIAMTSTAPTTTTFHTTTLPTITITTMQPTTTTLSSTTTTLPTTTTISGMTTTTMLPTTKTTVLPTTTTVLPTMTSTRLSTTTEPATITTTSSTTTEPATITTTSSTTTTTIKPITTTTILPTMTSTTWPTTESIADLKIHLERSTIKTHRIPYNDDVETTESLKNVTEFVITSTTTPCESDECEQITERVATTTTLPSTTPTSTVEITRDTSSARPTTYVNFHSEPAVSSTTEPIKTSVTKGDCVKACLERCRFKSDSFEISARSCETSCESVTDDCNENSAGGDSASKGSSECEMERNCGCTKEENSAECTQACSTESSSCEEDCAKSKVPLLDVKFENARRRAVMCEIRDLYHRRQQSRLAKMRANSAGAAVVTTSRVDILRPTMSRRRERIASKKLRSLSPTQLYFKNRKTTKLSVLKTPLDDKLSENRKDRNQQKQVGMARRHMSRKRSRKLIRGSTIESHHTVAQRGIARDSQTKRIPLTSIDIKEDEIEA
ncbi:hypothetical protein PUN28_001580 [Cardiocondyla obscurior]|uniref:Zonadhesin n=1 Tax=Cardiocondyla obscurior TaxID=286306 RepID=A0AAW2H636_9HYME